jgi:hypothetical protein
LSVNVLMDAVRAAFPNVGRIYPFTIYYDIHVPDGRVVEFESEEEVTVPWVLDDLLVVLVDTTEGSVDTLRNPGDYGLSDDVIRYLTTSEAIQVDQRV